MASHDLSPAVTRWRVAGADTALLWLIPAAIYYAFLLSAGSAGLFAPVQHGLTFNSMLLHLLHGRFDVDPAMIGDEGFSHAGATYAYFGVFPALFRAAFLWMPNFATSDFTRLSCLVAVSGMALFKVLSALVVWRAADAPRKGGLLALLAVAILASGPQIEFLRPSIFQEVELWAGLFGAAFVYVVLRGLVRDEGFSPRLLALLAVIAGLCLLTRVSNAVGLYAAFGLIWLHAAWRGWRRDKPALARLMPAALVAVIGVGLTGAVNFERWGNPLVFIDFSQALIGSRYPEQLPPLAEYGAFNPIRLGFGLIYYFVPLWVLRDGAGQLWWDHFQRHAISAVELPPASFFVSDPLLLGLAALGLIAVWRQHKEGEHAALPAVLGLFIPAALMLCGPSMSFRYRMEFYPFFELLAFLGFARLLATPRRPSSVLVGAGAFLGVAGSHLSWLLYMLSPFGTSDRVLGSLGIVDFYKSLFQ